MLNGYIQPDFKEVAAVFQDQIPSSKPGGAAFAVFYRGKCVMDVWGGTKDEAGTPWQKDTIALSYSTTKGVMSTLMHILTDRGLLDYDDPVCKYWPEFAQSGKEKITIRQVMCHEAGLYNIRGMIDSAVRITDWQYMTDTLAGAAPAHDPGIEHGYHGFTYGWIVGEIIRRAAKKEIPQLLQEEISGPLELDGLYVGLPADQMHRRARLIRNLLQNKTMAKLSEGRASKYIFNAAHYLWRTFSFKRINLKNAAGALFPRGLFNVDFNSEEVAASQIPSVNGMFSARSLAKMYAVIANGGELDGVRLFSEETLRRVGEKQNRGLDSVFPFPMGWRLGYHSVFTIRKKVKRGFGHFGFGGSGGWADPERNLSMGMVLNSGIGSPFGDLRIIRLNEALVRCVDAL